MRALVLLLAALLALAAPAALAYPDPQEVPAYAESECFDAYNKRFVHDYIGLFDPADARLLESAACEAYALTSAHYVVVAVATTAGETLESYALHLFEGWRVGDRERLDGLMLVYVDDYLASGTAAARIEVGYGLEGVLNSAATSEAWREMLAARDHALGEGRSDREARAFGILAGSSFLLDTLVAGYTEAGFPPPEPPSQAPPLLFWIVVILAVILLAWLMSRSARGRRGWGYHVGSAAWSSGFGSSWARGGSGGFRGGGSFGGGRSGGAGRGGKF